MCMHTTNTYTHIYIYQANQMKFANGTHLFVSAVFSFLPYISLSRRNLYQGALLQQPLPFPLPFHSSYSVYLSICLFHYLPIYFLNLHPLLVQKVKKKPKTKRWTDRRRKNATTSKLNQKTERLTACNVYIWDTRRRRRRETHKLGTRINQIICFKNNYSVKLFILLSRA